MVWRGTLLTLRIWFLNLEKLACQKTIITIANAIMKKANFRLENSTC